MSSFNAHSLLQMIRALDLLSRSQGATIVELQTELEVSRRTVHRVFDLIHSLGIPMEDDQIFGESVKRYYIEPGYVQRAGLITVPNLPNVPFTLQEVLVLQYLFQSGGVFRNTATETVLQSLRKKLSFLVEIQGFELPGAGLDSLFQVTSKMSKDYTGKEDLMADLADAILSQKACQVTYHSFQNDQVKTYQIHPLKIVEHKGGLYVFVRVVKHGTINILALERIKDLQVGDEEFEYPKDFDPEALLNAAFDLTFGEKHRVKIRFSPKEARYIKERRWAEDQVLEETPDQGVILTMTASGLEDMKRWVLQYGRGAEVLEPDTLRTAVREEISAMAEALGVGNGTPPSDPQPSAEKS